MKNCICYIVSDSVFQLVSHSDNCYIYHDTIVNFHHFMINRSTFTDNNSHQILCYSLQNLFFIQKCSNFNILLWADSMVGVFQPFYDTVYKIQTQFGQRCVIICIFLCDLLSCRLFL